MLPIIYKVPTVFLVCATRKYKLFNGYHNLRTRAQICELGPKFANFENRRPVLKFESLTVSGYVGSLARIRGFSQYI